MAKTIKVLLSILIVATLFFAAAVYLGTYHPAPVEAEAVHGDADVPTLSAGQSLKLLSWNVQFMAGGENNHFFYDDGPDPWPDAPTVTDVTRRVAEFIAEVDADFVLLQEVDDLATRTHLRDQVAALRALLPQYGAYTETFYWKATYVPHPAIRGRVGMKLVVLSKYRLGAATRHALSAITTDDFLTRQFNLKRALQQVQLPVDGGEDLILVNTHLSAFAQGSDTMARQVDQVLSRLNALPENAPWVLAGDFNLLPHNDVLPSRPDLERSYNAEGTELEPLISRYPSIPPLARLRENPEPWYTYMPPDDPQRRPDRSIDYIFYSPELNAGMGEVLRGDARTLSDHLPLVFEFTL